MLSGKLKISNEMKQKLEAVTSSSKGEAKVKSPEVTNEANDFEVGKLNENRKMLIEQKLGGGK